jgi:hypothetical protein
MAEELVHIPQDLTLVSDQELADYGTKAVTEFDRINALEQVTADTVQYGMRLADDVDRIRAEMAARKARAEEASRVAQAKLVSDQQNLRLRVHGPGEGDGDGGVQPGESHGADAETIAAAAARGATAALVSVLGDRVAGRELTRVTERASLSDARRFAPPGDVPREKLSITASVDIPGVARGEGVDSLDRLVDIVQRKAKSMPVSHDNPNMQLVASIRNEFEHTIDDRTAPGQVKELFDHLTSQDKKDSLVAAGGWCAPSEIRYDFFNISCEDGLVDLPTFGVSRGGIQFPVSPSLADVFGASPNQAFGGFSEPFSGDSIPWLWTEADDIAAVTGGGGTTPFKPCIRVPCPTFEEERLECYGICVTAGNLTDDAYPEATANFLQLMMAAHAHAMNGRIIGHMVTLSEAAIDTGSFAVTGQPVYQQIYGGLSLAATDYRARYGMCEGDTLEVVAPFWVKAVIRADLAWRNGEDVRQVSDAEINSHFAALNVRVQWVNDWQVRGSGQFGNATEIDDWPTSATFMVYAAGTFIKGNGLSLDLGVVRDSTLNEVNDHTAAWSEECHLVAKVGHESRQYTINFCVNGKTGGQLAAGAACTNL